MALVANTLNTVSYDSQQAILLSSAAVTDTLPLRIVDLVPDTAFTYSGTVYYPEAIVKFNMPNITGSTFLVVMPTTTQLDCKGKLKWLFHAHNY